MVLALFLALSPLWAAEPASTQDVLRVFAQIEASVRQSAGLDVQAEHLSDRRAEALAPEVLRWKEKAVAPLAEIACDAKRPRKVRLWAATFLGMVKDASALEPLKRLLLDKSAPDEVRAAAVVGIDGLDLGPAARRRAFCAALVQELPRQTFGDVAVRVSAAGCDDPTALETRLRALGAAPKKEDEPIVFFLIAGLGSSHPETSARALLSLLDFYPRGSAERAKVLIALFDQQASLRLFPNEAAQKVDAALAEETAYPDAAVAAIRILAALQDKPSVPILLKLLDNGDAEVVAESASALAALRAKEAAPRLKIILDGALSDPRFAPGRIDPKLLYTKIEDALLLLQGKP